MLKIIEKKNVFFGLLLSCLFIIHYHSGKNNPYNTLNENVFFGGDQWEYQSLAVNILNGHGYRLGGVEPWEEYKFAFTEKKEFKEYFKSKSFYTFYRTPGYPLFLASIYKIFGVNPEIVNRIQFIMIVICASIMPLICYYYYGATGIFSGVISSFLFMRYFVSDLRTGSILTESLILFSILIWMFIYIYWEKEPTPFRILILGVFSGFLLFVKGSNIFIPFTFILFMICKFHFPQKNKLWQIITYVLAIVLTILPWSIYASLKSNKNIFLSIQGDTLLVECNNYNTANTGNWTRLHQFPVEYLWYDRPAGSTKRNVKTVFNFYKENPSMILLSIKNKINFATVYRPIKYCLLFFILYLITYHISHQFHRKYHFESVNQIFIIFFISIIFLTLIFYGSRRMLVPFMYFMLIPSIHFIFISPIYINTLLEKFNLYKNND